MPFLALLLLPARSLYMLLPSKSPCVLLPSKSPCVELRAKARQERGGRFHTLEQEEVGLESDCKVVHRDAVAGCELWRGREYCGTAVGTSCVSPRLLPVPGRYAQGLRRLLRPAADH